MFESQQKTIEDLMRDRYGHEPHGLEMGAVAAIANLRARVAELEAAIERWKVEELRQLQCQCAKPRAFLLGDVPWCEACEKPREWSDAAKVLRPDELALIERAIPSAKGEVSGR